MQESPLRLKQEIPMYKDSLEGTEISAEALKTSVASPNLRNEMDLGLTVLIFLTTLFFKRTRGNTHRRQRSRFKKKSDGRILRSLFKEGP